MAKVNELLFDLAKRAGIDENNDDLKLLMSATGLNSVEVPETLVKSLNTGLLDMNTARSNPILKSHYIGQFAPGIEQTYFGILKELGLSDEEIKDIQDSDISTGKRIAYSKEKLKSLLESAKKSKGGEANEELKRILAESEQKLKNIAAEKDKAYNDLKSQYVDKARNAAFEKLVSPLKLKGIPDAVKATVVKTLFEKWVSDAKGKLEFDEVEEKFTLKNGTDPTLDFQHEGKIFGVQDFLSLNLQKDNLLETSSGGSGGSGGQQHKQFPENKQEAPKDNEYVTRQNLSFLEQQLKQYAS